MAGRPRSYTPEALGEAFDRYMQYALDNHRFVNIAGMCLHMEINPDTYYSYKQQQEYSDTIKRIEFALEDACLNANDHPSMKIFYLKNKFGYADKQEVSSINTNLNYEIPTTEDEIDKRISELINKTVK